jgi:hypothetical protein
MQPGRVKTADLIMFLVGLAVVVGAVLWTVLG